MDIQPVSEYDAPEIHALIEEHFPYLDMDFDTLVKRILHSSFFFRKTLENEQFAGYAEWQRMKNPEKTIQLNGIVVKPWYQGKGHGNALLAEGEKWAKRTGMNAIQLLVAQSNETAQRLYEKNGYTFVRMHPHRIGGEKTEVWAKKIR